MGKHGGVQLAEWVADGVMEDVAVDEGNLPFRQMVFLAGNQQLHCAFLNVNDLQLLVPVPDDSVRGKVAETAQIPGAGKFRRPVRIQFPSGRVNVQSAILKSHKSAPCLFCYIIRRYSDCVKRVSAVLYKGQHRTIASASLSRLLLHFRSSENGKYIQYSSIFGTLNWNKNPA